MSGVPRGSWSWLPTRMVAAKSFEDQSCGGGRSASPFAWTAEAAIATWSPIAEFAGVMLDRGAGLTYIGGTSISEGLGYARRIQEIHPARQCCGYGGRRGDWRCLWRRGRFLDKRPTDAIYWGCCEVARLFES